MKIITVANRKGGTGKTTTVVNLAGEWAKRGYNTLVIDLDTQGHSGLGFGMQSQQAQCTVHQLFRDKQATLQTVIKQTAIDKVSIALADNQFMATDIDKSRLKSALYQLALDRVYDRVIIDTPPTLDGLLYNGLVAADGVIIPFVPHHLVEVGVKQLAKLFYQVATTLNTNLSLLGLLPVMYDRKIKLHQRVMQELGKQFGKNRILRGIRNNIKLAESFETGKPVAQFAPNSAGAMDYHLLTEELEYFL